MSKLAEELSDDEYLKSAIDICKKVDTDRIRAIFHSSYPVDFLEAFIEAVARELKVDARRRL